MSSDRIDMGIRLRKARGRMGLTIRKAAGEVGISPIRLSQWERGIRSPSNENLVKLAVLYMVLVDELCYGLRQKEVKKRDKKNRLRNEKQLRHYREKPP